LPKNLSQQSSFRLFLWGLVLIPLATLMDAILDAILYGEGTIAQQLFSPSYHELAMRFLFSVFILAAIYLGMHYLANTAQRERSLQRLNNDLGLARQDLEEFNHDLLQHLRNTSAELNTTVALLQNQCAQDLDEKTRFFMEALISGNNKLNKQLETGLALNEIPLSEPHRERIKLDKLALEIAEELQCKYPERALTFKIEPWLTAMTDRKLMRLVLEQLFRNAIDFIPPSRKGTIELGMFRRGEQKVLFVRDNGTGYSETQALHLFDAFRDPGLNRDLPQNTLRLASAQRAVRRLGGQIWAEGAEGAGGTVFFTYYRHNR